MNEKRYHVIFTGKTKPEVGRDTVKSNLVLDMGMTAQKVDYLLTQTRVVLKRCDTIVEAQRLAEKFDRSGVICYIVDSMEEEEAAARSTNGESSLMRLMTRFLHSGRRAADEVATK